MRGRSSGVDPSSWRDEALAEELAQDVFVRAWEKLGTFRGDSAFSSWLHPLTVNVALTERRSRQHREGREQQDEDPHPIGHSLSDSPCQRRR